MATTAKSEEDLLREIARMEALIAASQRPAAPVKKPPSYSYSRPGTTYTRPTYTYNNGTLSNAWCYYFLIIFFAVRFASSCLTRTYFRV
jgi:hypothetical protein